MIEIDVLREQIDKYRQVFMITSAQIKKLDDAMTKYFGAPGQNPPPPPPPPPPSRPAASNPFADRTNRNQPPKIAQPNRNNHQHYDAPSR